MSIEPMSPEAIPKNGRKGSRGFSIVELVIVVSLVVVVTAMAIPLIGPAIEHSRLESGLEYVTMQLRRGRQGAVDHRRIHRVTIQARSVVLERLGGAGWERLSELELPQGVAFESPSSAGTGPDGYGYSAAVDFNDSNEIYFQPDGSARDATGQYVNGVVYLVNGHLEGSARAVTLFGATGRIKPWRSDPDRSSSLTATTQEAAAAWN